MQPTSWPYHIRSMTSLFFQVELRNFIIQQRPLHSRKHLISRSSISNSQFHSSTTYKRPTPLHAALITKKAFITGLTLFAVASSALIYNQQQQANMSSNLVPPNPDDVMVIRDVTPNVVTFSVPFLRFGKIPIGGRGTLGKPLSPNINKKAKY